MADLVICNEAVMLRDAEKETCMKYSEWIDNASAHQPDARAEDGMKQRSQWSELCQYVLIPIGTVFAIFLAMLGMMLHQ